MKFHVVCHGCLFEGLAPSDDAAQRAVDAHARKHPDHEVDTQQVNS